MANVAGLFGSGKSRVRSAAGRLHRVQAGVGALLGDVHGVRAAGDGVSAGPRFWPRPGTDGSRRVPSVAQLHRLRHDGDRGHRRRHPGGRRLSDRAQPDQQRRRSGGRGVHHHCPRHPDLPRGAVPRRPLLGGSHLRAHQHHGRLLLHQLGGEPHGRRRVGPRMGAPFYPVVCADGRGEHYRFRHHAAQSVLALGSSALAQGQARVEAQGARRHLLRADRERRRAARGLLHQPRGRGRQLE
mmetsp:Transcript_58759/g.134791  ORF Transcript_58759/g.134791 Transcript_58759/m.134791 type:complete len:241 (-) Transcript_58759:828-1550(-)